MPIPNGLFEFGEYICGGLPKPRRQRLRQCPHRSEGSRRRDAAQRVHTANTPAQNVLLPDGASSSETFVPQHTLDANTSSSDGASSSETFVLQHTHAALLAQNALSSDGASSSESFVPQHTHTADTLSQNVLSSDGSSSSETVSLQQTVGATLAESVFSSVYAQQSSSETFVPQHSHDANAPSSVGSSSAEPFVMHHTFTFTLSENEFLLDGGSSPWIRLSPNRLRLSSETVPQSELFVGLFQCPVTKFAEERYLQYMKPLQFGTYDMIVEENDEIRFTVPHCFKRDALSAHNNHPARFRRLVEEAMNLPTSLPLHNGSSIFVRRDSDRMDVMKVLITGPAGTPYMNGCFEFDVYFPETYPKDPVKVYLATTGGGSVRFNPNLYESGKVCLSLLNTWAGSPTETWNAETSTFLQVLVSIQALVLVPEPFFNEPGVQNMPRTSFISQHSRRYNHQICSATVKWAMLMQLKNPSSCFESVIRSHFWMKKEEIFEQINNWITSVENDPYLRRAEKNTAVTSLKESFQLLQEEIAKLSPPPGLRDLENGIRGNLQDNELENNGTEMQSDPQPSTSGTAPAFSAPSTSRG